MGTRHAAGGRIFAVAPGIGERRPSRVFRKARCLMRPGGLPAQYPLGTEPNSQFFGTRTIWEAVCYGCLHLCYGWQEKVMSPFPKVSEDFDPKTAIWTNVYWYVTVETIRIVNVYAACYGCYGCTPPKGGWPASGPGLKGSNELNELNGHMEGGDARVRWDRPGSTAVKRGQG
jgi:hypothetical protein